MKIDLARCVGEVWRNLGARHFINYGLNEHRGTTFNGLDYIASNSDLIAAFGADGMPVHIITSSTALTSIEPRPLMASTISPVMPTWSEFTGLMSRREPHITSTTAATKAVRRILMVFLTSRNTLISWPLLARTTTQAHPTTSILKRRA
jgi:hypothetical protein